MKRSAAAIVTLVVGVLVALVPAGSASAHTPYCGITWGSLAKTDGHLPSSGHIHDVRAGRNTCYDRLVVDVHGDAAGYAVRYVSHVHEDGSGRVVPLRGGARLAVVAARSDDPDTGRLTYPINRRELVDVTGFRTFRQVAGAGSFEGQSTIGLGVRGRLPFRVFTLDGPGAGHSRLVIDVAHSW